MSFSSRNGLLRCLHLALLGGMLIPALLLADEPPAGEKSAPAVTDPAAVFENILQFDYAPFVTNQLIASGPTRPEENLSEFWIGLTGNPVDDVLRSHLEIAPDRGLLVTQVIENGPAARAGLKLNDVLLSTADKPLKEVADLATVIGEKKDALLALRLIRSGKPIIIELKPERRPPTQTGETCPAISKAKDDEFFRHSYLDLVGALPEAEKIKAFVDDSRKDKRTQLVNKLLRLSTIANRSCTSCHTAAAEDVKLYRSLLIDPSHHAPLNWKNVLTFDDRNVLSDLSSAHTTTRLLSQAALVDLYAAPSEPKPLPDDLTISITRRGKEPAAIKVTRGTDSWGATEKDYKETLPAEFHSHVETLFPPRPATITAAQDAARSWKVRYYPGFRLSIPDVTTSSPRTPSKAAPSNPAETKPSADVNALDRVQQQLENLDRQLSELRKSVRELKQSPPDGPAPKSDPESK